MNEPYETKAYQTCGGWAEPEKPGILSKNEQPMSLLKRIKKIFNKPTTPAPQQPKTTPPTAKPTEQKQKHTPRPESRNRKPYKNQDKRYDTNKPKEQRDTIYKQQQKKQRSLQKETTIVEHKGKPFSNLNLHPDLLKKLAENKFVISTNVQEKSVPAAIDGKNIFCSSETGSGKTLSFLLPMIHKFYNNQIDQALILCPTREIAIQIQKNLQLFSDENMTSALVIGGTNMELQKLELRKYPKILVATPGRLLDMLNTGYIWLNYTNYVVLDEADRMLDMGFEEDLIKIHSHLSGQHQTLLFSATLFPQIKKMAKRYASDYEEIIIGNPTSVATSVEHVLLQLKSDQKMSVLKYLIQRNPGKIMIFFNTIRDTQRMTQLLRRQGARDIECIHSKIDQSARESIISAFRENKIKVLLGSDIAARGIDVPNVEMVINYDIPNNAEEYIHRVGRTGRAGKTGIAVSFYDDVEKRKLEAVEKLIDCKIKRVNNERDII